MGNHATGFGSSATNGNTCLNIESFRRSAARLLAGIMAVSMMSFGLASTAHAQIIQTFYTPVKEAQLLPLLNQTSGNGAPVSPMHTVLSMVATRNGTVIYYDHWEDGFEANLSSPTQSSTLVLGDGNLANGCAGAYFPTPLACNSASHDLIDAGDILNRREDNIVIPRVATTILFDGGDKVGTTRSIAMTRSSWASGSNTLMGDATEIYDTTYYGTLFHFPVGERPATPGNPPYDLFSNGLFGVTTPMIMAAEDNTTISLDYNGDGTVDASTTLNEGQSFTAPIAANIHAGGTVTADKPVQVQLMTGNPGSTYAFDGFTLFPTERWATSYWTPVSRTCNQTQDGLEDSHVWLHNPNTSAITVNYQDKLATGTITLQPRETKPYTTVNSSGTNPSGSHFWTTDGSIFGAVGTMDSDLAPLTLGANSAWDWGYTLIPETSLSTAVLVGWGPGRDPTSATNPSENGNPIWVTVAGSYAGTKRVYADFDGDPSTGALTDPNDARYDAHFDLTALESRTIYDTVNADQDQTGTRVYTVDGSLISVAWGQDVCTASASAPGLDVGTTVLPVASIDFSKSAALQVDVNGNGVADPGDTLEYTLSIFNSSNVTASGINLTDTPDPNTTYVANSTFRDGTTSIPDNGSGTPFPLDGAGVSVGTLLPNASTEYTFQATINSTLPDGVESVTNVGVVTSSFGTFTARVTTPIRFPAFEVTKVSDPDNDPVQPGDNIDYTIVVTNTGDVTQTGIDVNDPLPAGTSYVTNSTFINAPSQPIRATEYYISGADDFTGTTYDLVLNRNLASDYFVIIQGSATLNDTGPARNYVRVTQDPFGTGDLDVSSAANVIRLQRQATSGSAWIGVVTVVESVTNQTTDGFRLRDVQAVSHAAAATSGTDTSGTAWTSINKVLLMGGFNGAGCTTTDTDPKDLGSCQTRLFPSGSNTINWQRDALSVRNGLADAVSTVMVVEWGSNWTVQRVNVVGSNGGDKVDIAGEYNTAALATAVARDNTWVWGTGTMTEGTGDQLKRNGEGQVITLGNGVAQNVTESTVAVGGYEGRGRSFDVYAMTHPELLVDYRFKPDGDKDFATVDVTVDSTATNRMALAYTGTSAGNDNTPHSLFSARFTNSTTVRLEQQRTSDDWAGWVQAIGFANVKEPTTNIAGGAPPLLASNYVLEPGQSMTVTYSVTVNNPPPSNIDEIFNLVSITSNEDVGPNEAETHDPLGSLIGDYVWYDLNGDGIQDPGEPGIPGVEVIITKGAVSYTLTTDANGFYQLILPPDGGGGGSVGDWTVSVNTATLPGGLTQTGDPDQPGTTCSTCDDQTIVNIGFVGDVELGADFGYRPSGSISGTVYDDSNVNNDQDFQEPGLANIEVGLFYADGVTPVLDSAGNPLRVTTDANGYYEFTNLPGGNYVIVVDPDGDTLPTNSTNYQEPDDTIPGPGGSGGGNDGRAAVTLAAGGSLTQQDFGYDVPNYLVKTRTPAQAHPGATISYTLTPSFDGAGLLTNATVSDVTPVGTTYVGTSDIPTATSEPAGGGTGTVSWNLGSNTAGTNGSGQDSIQCPAWTDLVATKDTHIFGRTGETNFNAGASTTLVARSDPSDLNHALVQFDLAGGLPANAIITTASLRLTVESNQNANRTVSIRQLTAGPWNEGAIAAESGGACSNGASWDQPTCSGSGWNGSGGNFSTAPYGASLGTISPAVDETTYSVPVTSVAQAWKTGASTNYGFAILGVGSDTNEVMFHSRTATTVSKRPTLRVGYTVPSTTACSPTPTVRDEFTNQSWSNNNGTALWSTSWVENDPEVAGQDPSAGRISVVAGAGTSGYLKFEHDKDVNGAWVYRQVDLSGPVTAATLTYNLLENGQDAVETVVVEVSNNGGTSYTTLETIQQGTATGARSFNLLTALGTVSSQTRVRIRQTAADSDDKHLRFDNFQVAWTLSPSPFSTSTLTAQPTLVKNGDTVNLTMTVSATRALSNITPTTPVVINATGGAACSGITGIDTSPKSIGSGGGSVNFTWSCTAASGTSLGAGVAFRSGTTSATGTDQYAQTVNLSTATSNSVLMPPVLQFQVVMDTPPPGLPNEILNRGYLQDSTTITNPVPSNMVRTTVLGSIAGTVENDLDGDGDFADADTPLAGVTITLSGTDFNGNPVNLVTVTAADGTYLFPDVPAGNYTITETDPAGFYSTNDVWPTPAVPGDMDNTITLTLAPGQDNTGNDFLDTQPTTVSGTVREDLNNDGSGDVPIAGVEITLTGTDGLGNAVSLTTYTDQNGNYTFNNVPPSPTPYTITETDPQGYVSVSDTDGANDNLISVTVSSGTPSTGNDYVDRRADGSIGDYIWLDEDGDGIQDAGEDGIANVRVTLTGTDVFGNAVSLVTYTDANGGYLFSGLPQSDGSGYTVAVDTASMPAGLAANPTFDPDGGTANQATYVLGDGQQVTTADFGYNWVSPTDTTNPSPGASGAIGDRVWIDANGDGIQGPGEAGLGGVTVKIYTDPDGDGIYNTLYATTTTAADGSYIFDGLPAGSYVVEVNNGTAPAGYSQTGDPDATLDNKSAPIALAPGDVYVNADFGYQPYTGAGNSIGDTVWLDLDRDGMIDAGEKGLAGVVINLTWYGPDGVAGNGDDVVFTTVTDENGYYLFEDLPDGDFDVTIAASNFAQGGALYDSIYPTYDADGTGTAHTSSITNLGVGSAAPVSNTAQDFGYTASNNNGTDGIIGDTVFYDANGNGVPDPGEGIPGVAVTVDDGINPPVTVYTDENGEWFVGDLPAGTYTVSVDPNSLPDNGAGLNNTIDPDGGTHNQSTVILPTNSSINLAQDFGYTGTNPLTNSIGDSVWLDADGDGIQDPGEPGIAGVVVQLTYYGDDGVAGGGDDVVYTTVTDANGNYVFDGLPNGNYSVTTNLAVNTGTGGPLNDLNASGDSYPGDAVENGTSEFTLSGGNNTITTLDFGWSPNTAGGDNGVIGDTVFLDLNSDGNADPGEGIAGVRVELYTSGQTPGVDTPVATTYTDANGQYHFGDLAAGTYQVYVAPSTLPAGLNATSDYDGGTLGQSTVTLATNTSVNLEQDFGYQPATSGGIGDTVFVDADLDGIQDAGEPGIAGVTVALVQDTNGNGIWDAGEPIIATTITDADGHYGYGGLQLDDGDGDADYLVWVNDTNNVLDGLVPVSDADGTSPASGVVQGYGISATALSAGTPQDLSQDFGYAPTGHDAGEGLIGDTIYLDVNGDGFQGADEPGLAGVTVNLYAADGTTLLATTTTNANGEYWFGNLFVDGDGENYVVRVDTTTLPFGGATLSNSGDPDGGTASESTVSLSTAAPNNFDQDFGYTATTPNTISGTIWNDSNADGTLNEFSAGLAGVTVALYDNAGNLIATTTTDAAGNYSFAGLPDGTYSVDVTDKNGVLTGYWHSDGPNDNLDNNSQDDPYSVTVSGGAVNTTADFGYFKAPAQVGDFVFNDLNGNGVFEPYGADGIPGTADDETGIAGVVVDLLITYPNGDTVTVSTITGDGTTDVNGDGVIDPAGSYSFGNLLLDENYDVSGPPPTKPSYQLSIDTSQPALAGYLSTQNGLAATPDGAEIAGNGVDNDADNVSGTAAYPEKGGSEPTNDFGFRLPSLTGIAWVDTNGNGIQDGAGEPALPGVTVNLYNSGGTLVGTTTTSVGGTDVTGDGFVDPAGTYYFGNLMPGNYTVEFVTPASYDETLQNQGANDALDSDYDPADGRVGVVIPAGTDVTDVDGGFIPLGSVSGTVYADYPAPDGAIDGDETPIQGVSIQLYRDTNGDGVLSATELLAGPFRTTVTDVNGDYLFSDVPVGNYIVVEQDPAGFVSVLDESIIDGDQANTNTNDNAIPVNVAFNTVDAGNNFLDTVNSTVAVDDDNNTLVDTPVGGSVLFNDFDPQGHTQVFQGFEDPQNPGTYVSTGTLNTIPGTDSDGNPVADAGDLAINPDGTYVFTPTEGFTGKISIPYLVCDNGTPQACDTAILTITVEPLPDPFDTNTNSTVANDDDDVSYGDPVSGDVHDNDFDPEGDSFSTTDWLADINGDGNLTPVSLGSTQTVYGTDTNGNIVVAGTLTLDSNGIYTFTPCTDGSTPVAACDGAFYGTVSVDYENTDANGATDTATLTIHVLNETDEFLGGPVGGVNDPPVAGDDLSITKVNTPVTGNWANNDSEPNGDNIQITVQNFDGSGSPTTSGSIDLDAPAGGSIATVTTEQGGTVEFFADGTYIYTPPTGYTGPDKVTYQICDVGALANPQPLCDVATIYLLVTPLMDFGDLPDSVGGAQGPPPWAPAWGVKGAPSARHFIKPGLRLGLVIDAEGDGAPTLLTDGDDAAGASDDEDSTTYAAIGPDDGDMIPEESLGETVYYALGVLVQNDTGKDAALVGYIDWNCDGELQEPAERARVIVDGDNTDSGGECMYTPSTTTRYCLLEWGTKDGPDPLMSKDAADDCTVEASQKRTYARLRLTTQPSFFTDASPDPNGPARDGEVEDYNIIADASTTPAVITDVQAMGAEDGGAVLEWTTASELASVAFRLERLDDGSNGQAGRWTRVHEGGWIPARLELQGGHYRVFDSGVEAGQTHYYRIIEQTHKGKNLTYGPYAVTVSEGSAVLDSEDGFEVTGRLDIETVVENVERREAAKGKAKGKDKQVSSDTLRLLIDETGLYGLDVPELAAAFAISEGQLRSRLRQGELGLTSRGQQVPWFEQDDTLYFYGEASDNKLNLYRTYWLKLSTSGVPMVQQDAPASGPGAPSFIDDAYFEEDALWWLTLTTDPEEDIWFWNILSPFGRTADYQLATPSAQPQDGELTLRLWGATNTTHSLSVALSDGTPLGTIQFAGDTRHDALLAVPASAFAGDSLDIRVTLNNSPTGAYSSVLVDALEVSWARGFEADSGSLEYATSGATRVDGFASDGLITLDITDVNAPVRITGGDIDDATGSYAFSADLPEGMYLTTETQAALKPVSMSMDIKSNLASKGNKADYVVITQSELTEAAQTLADYRSLDFRTMVVDIQDVYDEFSFGEIDTGAMQSFAMASQGWNTPPRFFAIMGDGSFDYRDLTGTGYDFVSPQMFGNSNGLYASDTLQGDLDGDGVPEVTFGRIPAKSVDEGLAYVSKLAAYEAGIGDLPSLLISDKPDKGGHFAFSTVLVDQVVDGQTIKIDLAQSSLADARNQLAEDLADGVRLVNYLGHGSIDRVSGSGLIVNGDVAGMDNTITPSFVGLSCLINNYSIPGFDGLGERLVAQSESGMVASWAASGESFNDQATELAVAFHAVQGSYQYLGDAIMATFQARPYLVPVYTLVGDPALKLQ